MINSKLLFQLKTLSNVSKISLHTKQSFCSKSSGNVEDSIPNIKQQILNKAIEFVPESGWSKDALVRAAKSLGFPPQVHGLINEGALELIYHFYDTRTQLTSQRLDELVEKYEINKTKIDAKIILFEGVKYRLSLIIPVIDRWPEAIVKMSSPVNIPRTAWLYRNLLDELWIKAGDKATNISWYSKRAVLAAAYGSTELFMLQDRSPDYVETWHFLDRRLNEASSIGHIGIAAKDIIRNSQESCDALSTIFRNVTGFYRK